MITTPRSWFPAVMLAVVVVGWSASLHRVDSRPPGPQHHPNPGPHLSDYKECETARRLLRAHLGAERELVG